MRKWIAILCLVPWAAFADSTIFYASGGKSGTTMFDDIVLCGQLTNASTNYVGPGTATYLGGATDYAIGGTACDALHSTTEETADAPISADFPAFRVHGMFCRISSDPASDVVVTARSAAANLSPSFTCTIAGTGTATSCRTTNTSTSDVAAAATIAVRAVTLEDLSAQDVWCKLFFSVK